MGLDILLNPPNICLVKTTSVLNIVPESEDFLLGTVYKINAYTYNCIVGDRVLFNRTQSVLITQQEGLVPPSYFIIDEADFKYKELTPP
jgi:hypothetical protein